jgi:PQQ-dependent dehydrogenase (methanol/ethanol family)
MYPPRGALFRGLTVLLVAYLASVPFSARGSGTSQVKGATAPAANSEWPLLGGNSDQWQHSPLARINDKNVQKLGLAWVAEMGPGDGLVGNPLVADGVVYQSGPPGQIYANDLRTGKQLWNFYPDMEILPGRSWTAYWASHFNRGLALDEKAVFVASNCRILAVDRKSGQQLWAAQSCDSSKQYGIPGAPRVGGGKVFIGNSAGDTGGDRGYVDAFDAKTGRHLWRFYTMPGDPSQPFENPQLAMAAKTWGTDYWKYSHGANSPWEAITYDPSTDTLYFGTDGPGPWNPVLRAPDAGDELFSNCIIAVNASTGQYLWHYQTTPHDGWNLAAAMHIMLADLPRAGGSRQRVVMTAPKNGFFYVLDAKTGKFISANNYVPVNWASHIDPASGRPVRIGDANFWEHPGTEVLTLPGDVGGHSWELMAFQPALGLVYIPATIAPVAMTSDPKLPGGILLDYYYGYRPDAKVKAKGELIAWDPVTQTKRWSVDRLVPINGGILATDGNLVFQGTADGKFEAFTADTGRRLWSYDVHGSILAAPTTVEVDGVQTVLVPSGNGGSAATRAAPRLMNTERSRGPSRLLAFQLDGKATLPSVAAKPIPRPPRPKQPTELAEKGGRLFESYSCSPCHGRLAEGSGPGIPDLRELSEAKHKILKDIVIGGALRAGGMPPFPDMTDAELEALRAYLINQAWARYERRR